MKRFLAMLLCLVMLMTTACSSSEDTPPAATAPTTAPTAPPAPAPTGETTTLMVYMVGSDLEAKARAGTNDLDEMAASGVDLTNNNVIVYAGGTKKWHNDVAATEKHTTLKLTADGFVSVNAVDTVSMGEAAPLADFLNYTYTNFPADRYALILWDHGNGPLIGYGKDMLFDNDSLTLAEMQEALEASPFKGDNKLAFVGFDACLMSSAELVCVWDDHADYLIASQEVEPAFGWNYGFLKDLGKTDIKTLATGITDTYLTACKEYYDKKGYDHRDTTLACMDLAKAPALETALNGLFAAAAGDVETAYNELAATRVDTRALGRATTGSEYDLVDLLDMTDRLTARYPAETAALKTAIDDLVIANATNTERLCGLSLYYPFFNKDYFEKDWSAAYQDLGLFDSYQTYLGSYSAEWLSEDEIADFTQSIMPSVGGDNAYALELTDEQAAVYAESSFIVFTKEGDGLFNPVFISNNITKSGNRLLADFDGRVLYGKTGLGDYFLPSSKQHDSVGDITRYSVFVGLYNDPVLWTDRDDTTEYVSQSCNYQLSVNNKTGAVTVCSLIPYDEEASATMMIGGKLEDVDLSQYTQYYFSKHAHYFLKRDDNGVVLPLSEWPRSAAFTAFVCNVQDGISFEMAPLTAGEYYFAYQIKDTHGNEYCSELLPIQTGGELLGHTYAAPVESTWSSGDKVTILERENVTVRLTKTEEMGNDFEDTQRYALEVENRNDYPVVIQVEELGINDTVYCHDASAGYFAIPAGETVADTIDFGCAQGVVDIASLSSMEMILTLQHATTCKTLIDRQIVYVTIGSAGHLTSHNPMFSSTISEFAAPLRGSYTENKALFSENGLTATVLRVGSRTGAADDGLYVWMKFTNNSSETVNLTPEGVIVGDVYVPMNAAMFAVPAGMTAYCRGIVDAADLDSNMVSSINSLKIQIDFMDYLTITGTGGFRKPKTYTIPLTQSAAPSVFTEGSTLLLDEGGLRMALCSYSDGDWYLSVVNNSGRDISLDIAEATVDGRVIEVLAYDNLFVYDSRVPNGMKTVARVTYFSETPPKEVVLKFNVMDFVGETLYETLDTTITLRS